MEESDLPEKETTDWSITERMILSLNTSQKWGKITSITSMILLGFMSLVIMGSAMFIYYDLARGSTVSSLIPILIIVFIILFIAYSMFIFFQMYRFSDEMKKAISYKDTINLRSSTSYLTAYFKNASILIIIYLGFILFFMLWSFGSARGF